MSWLGPNFCKAVVITGLLITTFHVSPIRESLSAGDVKTWSECSGLRLKIELGNGAVSPAYDPAACLLSVHERAFGNAAGSKAQDPVSRFVPRLKEIL